MNEPNQTLLEEQKLTGRRYDSIQAMLCGEGVPDAIQKKAQELANARTLGIHLARMRMRAGLNQGEMAKRLGVAQGTVSKLESAKDAEITVKDIQQYSLICNERFIIRFGKKMNHVEAIKRDAQSIRDNLEALAKIANQDETLEKEISSFFGEAFFNFLTIFASCNEKLSQGKDDFEMRIETASSGTRTYYKRPEAKGVIPA
jgi:transcriptional regulator with XRE-family HTH domain